MDLEKIKQILELLGPLGTEVQESFYVILGVVLVKPMLVFVGSMTALGMGFLLIKRIIKNVKFESDFHDLASTLDIRNHDRLEGEIKYFKNNSTS
jgi:hypothetical protein